MTDLADAPIAADAPRLAAADLSEPLARLEGWQLDDDGTSIRRDWVLPNFRRAAQLANLAAWQAEAANHHPDIRFGWGHVRITYSTHSAGGVTMNDLIMAARLNRALAGDAPRPG